MITLAQSYHSWTLRIAETTGLPDALLHLHSGLAILLLARLVTGRSFGSFIPFLFVIPAEGANEVLDYLAGGFNRADALSDIAYTLTWPFLISLAACIRPVKRKRPPELAEPNASRADS